MADPDPLGPDRPGPDRLGPDDVGPDDVGEAVQAQLQALRERPVGEHVGAYDRVDRLLRSALADLDEG